MNPTRYVSTRDGVAPTALSDAIAAGLASDGGLYVPAVLPQVPVSTFDGAIALPETARRLLDPFFAGDPLAGALPAVCEQAFAFDAPLRATHENNTFALELFHGPTAAFKDFGARFLAACASKLPFEPRTRTVLVATSGDTGAAVAAAFHRRPGFRVVVLYPDGLVSPRQAHQLGCFGDNVAALRVAGTFDDCQRLAKQAFADAALRERSPLLSANSISLARLLPQMAYYARAALAHQREFGTRLSFAVPTGNLGNAFACVLARAVGLPIADIALATNANRTLADFLASGVYRARASVATLANAMDVGDPSNAERLRWLFRDHAQLTAAVRADWVGDAAIRARIRDSESRYGAPWCPHTACAVEVVEGLRRAGDSRPWAVVATAHPAKFEGVVEPLVGHAVAPPPELAAMLSRPSHADPIPADYATLRQRLALL
jgi:threonine synthase